MTVVAHCRRAGLLRLLHGMALLGLLIGSAVAATAAFIWVVVVGLIAALAVGAFRYKPIRAILLGLVVVVCAPFLALVAFQPNSVADATGGFGDWLGNLDVRFDTGALWLTGALLCVTLATAAFRAGLVAQLPTAQHTTGSSERFPSDADLVIYSGSQPFAGSGQYVRGGQFSVPLRPADPTRAGYTSAFTTGELVDRLRAGVSALGAGPDSSRLAGLSVADQAFIPGTSALSTVRRIDEHFARPGVMASVIERPAPGLRHFLRCQVIGWEGELVTSVYVQAVVEGATLQLEFAVLVLPPTSGDYHVFPGGRAAGRGGFAHIAATAVAGIPHDAVVSPHTIVMAVGEAIGGRRRAGVPPGRIDRGARPSIRELGASLVPLHYFQQRDVLRHAEILERRVFAETAAFLSEKGLDTGELDRRAVSIINHGVVNTGTGTLNIGAVGEHATGTLNIGET